MCGNNQTSVCFPKYLMKFVFFCTIPFRACELSLYITFLNLLLINILHYEEKYQKY